MTTGNRHRKFREVLTYGFATMSADRQTDHTDTHHNILHPSQERVNLAFLCYISHLSKTRF